MELLQADQVVEMLYSGFGLSLSLIVSLHPASLCLGSILKKTLFMCQEKWFLLHLPSLATTEEKRIFPDNSRGKKISVFDVLSPDLSHIHSQWFTVAARWLKP